ncbi:hypothetical protein PIB30_021856 [Stylosanthes scabra]|uniref:Uncharacterized protein n=1 Tax=Stylosanthes scabra TaxID=79078 RepID=A0ABU6Z810_9FABA|nr:hypothetical protein [Stylosanthes scabra]
MLWIGGRGVMLIIPIVAIVSCMSSFATDLAESSCVLPRIASSSLKATISTTPSSTSTLIRRIVGLGEICNREWLARVLVSIQHIIIRLKERLCFRNSEGTKSFHDGSGKTIVLFSESINDGLNNVVVINSSLRRCNKDVMSRSPSFIKALAVKNLVLVRFRGLDVAVLVVHEAYCVESAKSVVEATTIFDDVLAGAR